MELTSPAEVPQDLAHCSTTAPCSIVCVPSLKALLFAIFCLWYIGPVFVRVTILIEEKSACHLAQDRSPLLSTLRQFAWSWRQARFPPRHRKLLSTASAQARAIVRSLPPHWSPTKPATFMARLRKAVPAHAEPCSSFLHRRMATGPRA